MLPKSVPATAKASAHVLQLPSVETCSATGHPYLWPKAHQIYVTYFIIFHFWINLESWSILESLMQCTHSLFFFAKAAQCRIQLLAICFAE